MPRKKNIFQKYPYIKQKLIYLCYKYYIICNILKTIMTKVYYT